MELKKPRNCLTTVNVLGASALVVAVGRQVLLAVEEPLPWLSEAGELAYDTSLAIMTGWILNWLLVERPRRRDQIATFEVAGTRVQALGEVGRHIAITFSDHLGLAIADRDTGPTEGEWAQLCAHLDWRSSLTSTWISDGADLRNPTVVEFLLTEFDRADSFANKLDGVAIYLGVELAGLIHLEQSDPLRNLLRGSASALLQGPMATFAPMFVTYDNAGRRISNYYDANIRPLTSSSEA